jgi:hypothetical protein
MPAPGWKQLLHNASCFHGEGKYPIAAYSEFIPPPRLGIKPYGGRHYFEENDPWGWPVTEFEECFELRPGLENVARQMVGALVHLGCGRPAHGIARNKLENNPCWAPELCEQAGALGHERYVVLLPLALSRTQDDKGRLRWTLFGGSEQGPARVFWRSFFTAPRREIAEDHAHGFIRRLLATVYNESCEKLADLRGAGFRILPQGSGISYWQEDRLPAWTSPFLLSPRQPLRAVKYLLTFRPFPRLPAAVKKAYLAGDLHLIPFPGSLLFWSAPPFLRLQQELPLAMQIPLLHLVNRHEHPRGIRVPQSGWLHEPRPGQQAIGEHHGPIRNTYKRTHRWARVLRDEDELALLKREDKLLHVLFSTIPDDLGLYDKPMARNVQIWTHDFHLLLDGPRAHLEEIKKAAHQVEQGGLFGYRFQFPPLRIGAHEIYWHRPLVAYWSSQTNQPALVPDAPLGYLTAYHAARPDLARPVELWPRLLHREPYLASLHLFEQAADPRPHLTSRNVRKLLDGQYLRGGRPLPRPLARQMLTLAQHETLDSWLDGLAERAHDPDLGRWLTGILRGTLEPPLPSGENQWLRAGVRGKRPDSSRPLTLALSPGGARGGKGLTFDRTAKRSFEVAYWKTIAYLAEGEYRNKNNADCVRDPVTQRHLTHHQRDLEALGDYLLAYYRRIISGRMKGKALAGELPFHWQTDFDFSWSGGWLKNREGETHERDLIVVIPGRDRRRAVIMADHYDTAYMEDYYEKAPGGCGPRLAASGADDNHSATAALMLAAPIFLELSKKAKLACDIWLVHLTGEEFPADCLGARHLCQKLVEKNLRITLPSGKQKDLSKVRIQGVYVLDMVAHNSDRERDVFQIAPGSGPESFWLAYQAHVANEIWNAEVPIWNRRPLRRGRGRSQRPPSLPSPHERGRVGVGVVPEVALHPHLHGEVRLPNDPRSTLYNTDGQIFSDTGVPVVLFMENYDITRTGYHDSHDTMENIDLDYGAAVAAIAIEAVARAATEKVGS